MTTTTLPDWKTLSDAEKTDLVRPLWLEQGLSASQIAGYFAHATRSAIIGYVHRKHMQRAPKPKAATVKRQATANYIRKTPRRPAEALLAAPTEPVATSPTGFDPLREDRPPLASAARPLTILELPWREVGVCRFPVIGGYCGNKCGEYTYCESHRSIAYNSAGVAEANKKARKIAKGAA